MSNPRTTQPENLEARSSQSPRFSVGEWFKMFLVIVEHWEDLHPDQTVSDPCLKCLRYLLATNRHMHLPIVEREEENNPADGASEATVSDPGDRRLWDHVSPESSFLAEHLPPVLPVPDRSPTPPSPTAVAAVFADRASLITCLLANGCTHIREVLARREDNTGTSAERKVPLAGGRRARAESVADSLDEYSVDETLSTVSGSVADSLYTRFEDLSLALPDPATAAMQSVPVARVQPVPVARVQPVPVAPVQPVPVTPVQPVPVAPVQSIPVAPVQPVPVSVAPFPGVVPAPASIPNAEYQPYFSPPSDASQWYIVTCGRAVGVFDNSALMGHSIGKVSGGAGRGGYSTRDAAIAAFHQAEAIGVVIQRRPH